MVIGGDRILSGPSAIALAETATQERAARYRERARQLTGMMLSESDLKLRGKLRELMERYRELAGIISGDTD